MKRILIAAAVVIGALLLAGAFGYTGPEDLLKVLRNASPVYLLIFLLTSALTFLIFAFRWQFILRCQSERIPFRKIFSYKLMGYAVSYFTPAARIGGEPVRAYMLKRHGIRMSKGISSVLVDKMMEFVVEFGAGIIFLLVAALFFTIPNQLKTAIIIAIPLGLGLLALSYYAIRRKWKPISAFLRLAGKIFRIRWLHWAREKAIRVEQNFLFFFAFRKRETMKIAGINLFVWGLRFFEYKVALLSFGYDASMPQLFAAMLVMAVASIIPIPASLGVAEAGQISLFSAFGAGPQIGLILALLLRARDVLISLTGMYLLSHEGVGFFEAFRNRNSEKNGYQYHKGKMIHYYKR
ncbi:flippase-like domain-containing protein [Candidatus Woesearchaeota archaeon]|nr:flippase-like domain-containing protein [Candidatus Woesearchaeota archaeon]